MASFSITSFNTRWGLDAGDRPFDLAGTVEQFDTDLVALQEVWVPTGEVATLEADVAALGYRLLHAALAPSFLVPQPEITADVDRADGTWGVALLTRLPLRHVRTVDLGRLVERWDVATRFAVLAEVDVGGVVVTVAAHHLSFALPNALAQLRRLDGWLPRHRPSVVSGDCNLWGPLASVTLPRHRRAVRGRTWPSHRPHSQLDHVFVSQDLAVMAAEVLPTQGSDHLPIQAILRLRDGRG